MTEKSTYKTSQKPRGRGGYREGAGRKAKRGKTVVKRIPQQFENAVATLVEHLSKHSESDEVELFTSLEVDDLNQRAVSLDIRSELKQDEKITGDKPV